MTEQLRDLMHALADEQEPVRVDPGTYAAGRRAHRRGVVARCVLTAAAVAAVAFGTAPLLDRGTSGPADGDATPALPSVIHEVPARLAQFHEHGREWHEDVAAGTLAVGPTAVLLALDGAVMAVSAVDGGYRGLELPGFDEDAYFRFGGSLPAVLSPDGTRLAYTWNPQVIDGEAIARDADTGIRVVDLETGEVTDHPVDSEFGVYAHGFGWSPDGRLLSYTLESAADPSGRTSGSRDDYAVEVLDTDTGERTRTSLQPTEFGTAVTDEGAVAVAGSGYNAVWVPGRGVSRFEGDFAGTAWDRDGRQVALGAWSGGLAVADRDGVRREAARPPREDDLLVRTRPLGWLEDGRIAVLELGESSLVTYASTLEDSTKQALLRLEERPDLDKLTLATDLLSSPTRDYAPPEWPTNWTSIGLWLRLSALVLVPSALLVWVRRRRHR